MEPVCRPARDQRKGNEYPSFSRPLQWRLRTSTLWHSWVVLFLLTLYQLPLPMPPAMFLAFDFWSKSLEKFTRERYPSLRTSLVQVIVVERGVMDVRHSIHLDEIFMHSPRYCEDPWIAR
jgi:hypothetical protein